MIDTAQDTIHAMGLGTYHRMRNETVLGACGRPRIANRVRNRIDDAVWLGVVALTLENLPNERSK